MSTNTKKQGRKPRSKKDDTENINDSTQSIQTSENADAPVITSWSRESAIQLVEQKVDQDKDDNDDIEVIEDDDENDNDSKPFLKKKSVIDFDRNEITKLEEKKVSELTVNDLLMILIKRGENSDPKNPIVSIGCEKILRQINRERNGGMKKPFVKHKFRSAMSDRSDRYDRNEEYSFRSRGTGSRRGGFGRGDKNPRNEKA